MPLRLQCPHCRTVIQVSEQQQGKAVACGQCRKAFTVPAAKPAPLPVAVPAPVAASPPAQVPVETPAPAPAAAPVMAAAPAPAAPPVEPTPPPAASCRLDIGSCTHRGRVRQRNEDCFLVQHLTWSDLDICRETALVVVTDGLGGHQAGDQAARLVIRTVGSAMAGVLVEALGGQVRDTSLDTLSRSIRQAIRDANKAVHQKSQTDPACRGMGATVAAVLVWDGQVLVGHVGDCRVYHHRAGQLTQVTKDQTLVGRMVELGTLTAEEAASHPNRNEVSQAIGNRSDIDPSDYRLQLAPGDTLVVACDGLHTHVTLGALTNAIRKTGYSAALLANELVEMANRGGGSDNITVVAINGY